MVYSSMDSTAATRKASILSGNIKILEGIFEILDTHVSMDLEPGSPEFDEGCEKLEALESQIDKLDEERNFLWSLAFDFSKS